MEGSILKGVEIMKKKISKKYLVKHRNPQKGKKKWKIKLRCSRCNFEKFQVYFYSNRIEFVCDYCKKILVMER